MRKQTYLILLLILLTVIGGLFFYNSKIKSEIKHKGIEVSENDLNRLIIKIKKGMSIKKVKKVIGPLKYTEKFFEYGERQHIFDLSYDDGMDYGILTIYFEGEDKNEKVIKIIPFFGELD